MVMTTSHNRAILYRLSHRFEISSFSILVHLERAGFPYDSLNRNALLTSTMPPFHNLHALAINI